MSGLVKYTYEYTDTFGGERNYCWVNRGEVNARSAKHAMRLARACVGLTGCRGRYSDVGYYAEWVPNNCCTVLSVEVSND